MKDYLFLFSLMFVLKFLFLRAFVEQESRKICFSVVYCHRFIFRSNVFYVAHQTQSRVTELMRDNVILILFAILLCIGLKWSVGIRALHPNASQKSSLFNMFHTLQITYALYLTLQDLFSVQEPFRGLQCCFRLRPLTPHSCCGGPLHGCAGSFVGLGWSAPNDGTGRDGYGYHPALQIWQNWPDLHRSARVVW